MAPQNLESSLGPVTTPATMMDDIPDREKLKSMSRSDIQMLCKRHNIKANMRTDKMINALSELIGKFEPRLQPTSPEPVAPNPPPTPLPHFTPPPSTTTELGKAPVIEPRLPDSETLVLAARVAELEATIDLIPALKESVAQIPSLQEELKRLNSDLGRYLHANKELTVRTGTLERHVEELVEENATLKEHIKLLDNKLHNRTDKDVVITSVDISEPGSPEVKEEALDSHSIAEPLQHHTTSNPLNPPSSPQHPPSMTSTASLPTTISPRGDSLQHTGMTGDMALALSHRRSLQASLRASGRMERGNRYTPYSLPLRGPCPACGTVIPLLRGPCPRCGAGIPQPRNSFFNHSQGPHHTDPRRAHWHPSTYNPFDSMPPRTFTGPPARRPPVPAQMPNLLEGSGAQTTGDASRPLRLTWH